MLDGCRLRSDEEFVALTADERQPLGHPTAGLREVTGDLRADAEEDAARSTCRLRHSRPC
jgi:hypothetical protein